MRREDPSFEPAYPVVAARMRAVEGIEPEVYITDPTTGGCSDLFNAVYELLLQMIARSFAFGHETLEQRQILANAPSASCSRPSTAEPPACPPTGPDHPDATAGANFQLRYRASFLHPHRRSAGLRFAERLDELAAFAAAFIRQPEKMSRRQCPARCAGRARTSWSTSRRCDAAPAQLGPSRLKSEDSVSALR